MDRPALDPQTIAERVGAGMLAEDAASSGLGLRIDAMGPGYARMSMSVRAGMLNGFKICHGGYITLLADAGFAYACNSYNHATVAAGVVVDFVVPAREGDLLTAEAREVTRAGRTGVYDVTVTNQRGEVVALLRGRSHCVKGKQVVAL